MLSKQENSLQELNAHGFVKRCLVFDQSETLQRSFLVCVTNTAASAQTDIDLLSRRTSSTTYLHCDLKLDAEVSNGAVDLGVTEQQLDVAEIAVFR